MKKVNMLKLVFFKYILCQIIGVYYITWNVLNVLQLGGESNACCVTLKVIVWYLVLPQLETKE